MTVSAMAPMIFSTWCLKRCLLILLSLTLVLLVLTLTRNVMIGRQSVFEVQTLPTHTESGGIYQSLTNLLKDLTSGVDDGFDVKFGVNNTEFRHVLRQRASKDGVIILSSVDYGYLDLAFNLYFTSFKNLGIENYLFVGSDSRVCKALSEYDIACYDYIHDKDANKSSSYFSTAFKRKTHLKTKIILEALKLGLKVIITDVDIVFLKNPIPYLDCADCDIEISSDVVEGNSGFYIARPTKSAITLHNEAWKQGLARPEISNQKAIDRLLEKMHKRGHLKVRNLDPKVFANGVVFFENGKRMFKGDNPNPNSVIVHNNWIVSSQAKIYRFKECGLWESDVNGYFSDKNRKYLVFNLPVDFGEHGTRGEELKAIRTAFILGDLLNRTVIMPKFHCYGCKYNGICDIGGAKCTFGTFYRLDTFDKYFKNKYRENVFLSHHLVPISVKQSTSQPYLITSAVSEKYITNLSKKVRTLTSKNVTTGPTVRELREWFSSDQSSLLLFHSLYNSIQIDKEYSETHEVIEKVKVAFNKANSRQL